MDDNQAQPVKEEIKQDEVAPEATAEPEVQEVPEPTTEAPVAEPKATPAPEDTPEPLVEAETPAAPEPTTETPAQAEEETEEKLQPEVDTLTVRSEETGDKVYFLRKGERYWVKNPESLAKLGFYLGKEKRMPFSELLEYPEGEPIDLTLPEAVEPWNKSSEEKESQESDKPYKVWQ